MFKIQDASVATALIIAGYLRENADRGEAEPSEELRTAELGNVLVAIHNEIDDWAENLPADHPLRANGRPDLKPHEHAEEILSLVGEGDATEVLVRAIQAENGSTSDDLGNAARKVATRALTILRQSLPRPESDFPAASASVVTDAIDASRGLFRTLAAGAGGGGSSGSAFAPPPEVTDRIRTPQGHANRLVDMVGLADAVGAVIEAERLKGFTVHMTPAEASRRNFSAAYGAVLAAAKVLRGIADDDKHFDRLIANVMDQAMSGAPKAADPEDLVDPIGPGSVAWGKGEDVVAALRTIRAELVKHGKGDDYGIHVNSLLAMAAEEDGE